MEETRLAGKKSSPHELRSVGISGPCQGGCAGTEEADNSRRWLGVW